jgi:hypothetical protein
VHYIPEVLQFKFLFLHGHWASTCLEGPPPCPIPANQNWIYLQRPISNTICSMKYPFTVHGLTPKEFSFLKTSTPLPQNVYTSMWKSCVKTIAVLYFCLLRFCLILLVDMK